VAHDAAQRKAKAFCRVQSALYGFVDRLLSARPVDETRHIWTLEGTEVIDETERSFYHQVCEYLHSRLSEKTANRDIARQFNLSVPGLFKRLAGETDESPMKLFTRLRVEEAKGLLMQGQPLKTIARRAGFWDVYHLSKVFKRYAGLSPKNYLKALIGR
jgi:AraC-like DNA-binding protein